MHEERKKNRNRAALALALCFCVMALTSIFAVKSSLDKIREASQNTGTSQNTDIPDDAEAAVQTPIIDSQDNAADGDSTAKEYIMPIKGDIILKYSMDSLVYSKTLDQYMTHPGTDISAPLSTEVKAVADGTVTKIYNDDRYGITVQVTHKNGIISVYSNLAKQGLAETGDEVTQGQVIGCIGDTALFESMEEAHLHLEIIQDEKNIDPCSLIKELSQ